MKKLSSPCPIGNRSWALSRAAEAMYRSKGQGRTAKPLRQMLSILQRLAAVPKATVCLLGLALLGNSAAAQLCPATGPTVYGIDGTSPKLLSINSTTGVGTDVNGTGNDLLAASSALAWDPVNGKLWYCGSGTPSRIFSYNIATNTNIPNNASLGYPFFKNGTVNNAMAPNKAAYNPADGGIYFHSANPTNGGLFRLDPANPSAGAIWLGLLSVDGVTENGSNTSGGDIAFDALGNMTAAFNNANKLVVFKARYDVNGNYLGVSLAGQSFADIATAPASVAFLPNGNYLVGGSGAGIVDANTGTYTAFTSPSPTATSDYASCSTPMPNVSSVQKTAVRNCSNRSITYTITVQNTGTAHAYSAVLKDATPTGLTLTGGTLNGITIANPGIVGGAGLPLKSPGSIVDSVLMKGTTATIVLNYSYTAAGDGITFSNQGFVTYTGVETLNLPNDRIATDDPGTPAANDATAITQCTANPPVNCPNEIYSVGGSSSNELYVVDPASTFSAARTYPLPYGTFSIAVPGDGFAYTVSNSNSTAASRTIYKTDLSAAPTPAATTSTGIVLPALIAPSSYYISGSADKEGNIYFSGDHGNTLVQVTPGGTVNTIWNSANPVTVATNPTPPAGTTFTGDYKDLGLDANGDYYFIEDYGKRLWQVSKGTTTALYRGTVSVPAGVGVASDVFFVNGTLYMATADARIFRVNPVTMATTEVIRPAGQNQVWTDAASATCSFISLAPLTGRVLNDNNGQTGGVNGAPLAGTTVTLYAADAVTVLATTTTDATGNYFLNVSPNTTYIVGVTPPPGFSHVSSSDGVTPMDGKTTIAVPASGFVVGTNVDFGVNQPPFVGNNTLMNQTPGTVATIPNLLSNDTDPNGGTLLPDSLSLVPPAGATGIITDAQGDVTGFTVPGQGSWSLNSTTGSLTFTPQAGFTGNPTSIGYTVTDAAGLTGNQATVLVAYSGTSLCPATGPTLYSIYNPGVSSGGDRYLQSIDPVTGVGTHINGTGTDLLTASTALAWDVLFGKLWYCSSAILSPDGTRIFSYDIATNTNSPSTLATGYRFIKNGSVINMGGVNKAAYNPVDGKIYFHQASQGIFALDPAAPDSGAIWLGLLSVDGVTENGTTTSGGDIAFDGLGNLTGAFNNANKLVVFKAQYDNNGNYSGINLSGQSFTNTGTAPSGVAYLADGNYIVGSGTQSGTVNTNTGAFTSYSSTSATADYASCSTPTPTVSVQKTGTRNCSARSITYTLTVQNSGNTHAYAAVLKDTTLAGLTLTGGTQNGTALTAAQLTALNQGGLPLRSPGSTVDSVLMKGTTATVVLNYTYTTAADAQTFSNQGFVRYTGVELLHLPNNHIPSNDPGTAAAGDATALTGCYFSIGGSVFNDNNGTTGGPNGNSTGMGGLTVTLYAADGSTVIATTTTDASGNYTFASRAPGNYVVGVTPPAGFFHVSSTDATPTDGKTAITVAVANLSGVSFGINQAPVIVNDVLTGQTLGTPATIANVLANDSDPNGGTLSPDSVSLIAPGGATGIVTDAQGDTIGFTVPGQGTWSFNVSTGALTFTPQAGFTGNPTPVGYTVTDAAGLTGTTATVTISFRCANNQPPVANPNTRTINEDPAGTGTIAVSNSGVGSANNLITNDSDPNGTNSQLSITGFMVDGEAGTPVHPVATPYTLTGIGNITINANGSYAFTPVTNYNDTVPIISYILTDTCGATDTATLVIMINPVEDCPILNTSSQNVTEDIPKPITSSQIISDVDGTAGTGYTLVLALTNPNNLSPARHGFFTATSANGVTVVQGSGTDSIVVSGNYADLNAYFAGAATAPVYTPPVDYNTPGCGSIGQLHVIAFQAGAGLSGSTPPWKCDEQLRSLLISATPDALNYAVTAYQNAPKAFNILSGTGTTSGLANNYEVNTATPPQTVTVTAINGAAIVNPIAVTGGQLNVSANGDVVFTPNPGFTGAVPTFTYTTQPGTTGCAETRNVNITVNANASPTTVNDALTVNVGQTATVNVLANDSDPDGTLDATTVSLVPPAVSGVTTSTDAQGDVVSVTVPGQGTWTVNPTTGTVSFTPQAGFMGSPTPIQYTVKDNNGATSAPATITVTTNVAPTTADDSLTVNAGQTATVNVLANDSDPDGTLDPTTVSLVPPAVSGVTTSTDAQGDIVSVTVPGQGTWTVNPTTGVVSFTPQAGFTGSPTPIQYTVKDNNGATSAPATITVTTNVAPSTADDSLTVNAGQTATINVLANDSDPDGTLDATTVSLVPPAVSGVTTSTDAQGDIVSVTVPGEGTWAVNPTTGAVSFTPEAGFSGNPTSVGYTVRDNNGATSAPASVSVSFARPNLTPLIFFEPSIIFGAQTVTILVNIYEFNSAPTAGLITLRIPKDPDLPLSFNPTATSMNGNSVQNSHWNFDATSDPGFYILTSNTVLPADGFSAFGFTSFFQPRTHQGQKSISVTIQPGSGGEGSNDSIDNMDDDVLIYNF